jgi:hypothetical protein
VKDTGSIFLVQFAFVNFVGFRAPNYAACLVLVIGEFLPMKIGQEWFGPWSDDGHDFMSRSGLFNIRTPNDFVVRFDFWGCVWVWANVLAFALPYYGWLEEPFNESVVRDGVAFSAHAGEDVCRLVTVTSYVMKLEPLEPS